MPLERVETIPDLARRPAESHKGMYGTVLVVAGGRGMAGAAAMAGISALRSGAGLVRIACPAEVQPTVASFEPSYMTFPLENDADGLIRFEPARRALAPLLSSASVLAMGPGLGRSLREVGDRFHSFKRHRGSLLRGPFRNPAAPVPPGVRSGRRRGRR